jgi:3-oxoacyl-[acyl-carrier protein] reductase
VSERLAGRAAFVTGAQQGIGRATALALARAGADVGLNYLDDGENAARIAREVEAMGRRAAVVQGDVANPAHVERMIGTAARTLGRLDVLVNNAGVYPRVPFLEMKEGDWDLVLDVNLKGSFLCAQSAARVMVQGGRGGVIVNIASQAVRGAVLGVHYSASKSGILGMTRAMALELAPHNIRVNAVAPGLTDTAQPRYGHSEEALADLARAVPLGRMAQPDEIADVIVFLASDAARYITGQTINVNGGSYMP